MKKREVYFNMVWAAVLAAMIVFGGSWLRFVGLMFVLVELGVIGMSVGRMVDIQRIMENVIKGGSEKAHE